LSEAGAVLISFCLLFLYQDRKSKWGLGLNPILKYISTTIIDIPDTSSNQIIPLLFHTTLNFDIIIPIINSHTMKHVTLLTTILFSIIISIPLKAQLKTQGYNWKNVQIVGGGFVDGIIFHPKEKNLRYARTDMGGAYRWNEEEKRWMPLLDFISEKDANLMGIESIALDPNNPNKVYMACGTYTNPLTPTGAILWSDDKGATFHRVNVPIKFGGNENGRGNGERMAVDPNNGNIIYLGTRHNGLWRSRDAGQTWCNVTSFPNVIDSTELSNPARYWQGGSGTIFVLFNAAGAKKGKASKTIFAGVSLMNRSNLFVSNDAGKSWEAIKGQPTQYRPTHAVLSPDGNLYITYGTNPGPMPMTDGAVWKYNIQSGEWKDITPLKPNPAANLKFGYAAVSIDAQQPNTIIVSTFNRPWQLGGEEIYKSNDGGSSWTPVFATGKTFDYSLAPYIHHTGIHWLFDIEIDPFNSNHVMFTTGYGGHETYNFSNVDKKQVTIWSVMSTGIEETVALELLSPPQGPQLYSAIGDYCGYAHYDLDKPEPDCYTNPHFSNTNGIACAELSPNIVVRVGAASFHQQGTTIGYSLDAGKSWLTCNTLPDNKSRLGHIAVSSDGNAWIWTPDHQPPYVTTDRGNTWKKIENLPVDTRVIADKVNPNLFYAMALYDGQLFVSQDGGQSFEVYSLQLPNALPHRATFPDERGDERGGQDRLYATPGLEGDLWLPAWDGLYHTTSTNTPFQQLNSITQITAFGFGKAAPGSNYVALYLIGTINNTYGIFRSDDQAQSWIRINDDQHQFGKLLHITGDPKKYGRVYIGTHGRGIIYGDSVNE